MNDLVFAQNGQVLTNSLTISNVFDKRHDDILKAVRNLDCPADFKLRNFAELVGTYKNGIGVECKRPVFNITKDGFVLLVMGFTGKKAMEFKIKYIEAFNAMEKALSEPKADKPVLVSEHTRALPSGKREIVLSEKAKAEIGGIVKACLGTSKAGTPLGADAFKQLVKEAVAEFFFEQAAEDGEKNPSGRPFANWAVTAVHSVGAMQSEYHALRDKMQQAQNLLAAK